MKKFNFYRDANKNCKTVVNALENCDSIMYIKKTNTVCFFKHEGLILEANCKDTINFIQLAKNLNKRLVQPYF